MRLHALVASMHQHEGNDEPARPSLLSKIAGTISSGRYSAAKPLCLETLALREKVLGPEHIDSISSREDLALVLHRQGRCDEAEAIFIKQLAMPECLGEFILRRSNAWMDLRCAKVQRKNLDAELMLERRCDTRGALPVTRTVNAMNNLALVLKGKGGMRRPKQYFEGHSTSARKCQIEMKMEKWKS